MLHKHKPKTIRPLHHNKAPPNLTLPIIIIATLLMQHKQVPDKSIEKVINILTNKTIIIEQVQISSVKNVILIPIV